MQVLSFLYDLDLFLSVNDVRCISSVIFYVSYCYFIITTFECSPNLLEQAFLCPNQCLVCFNLYRFMLEFAVLLA